VPITILGEQFTLYRGSSGQPHLVAFRCAHRGTQLSVGWVEDDCIRCRYHGWKYDASGQCVEQPGDDEAFARRVSIRAYPTQEYAGLVFVYLGEGEPPPLRRYPDLEQPGVLIVDPPEVVPCNFWNRFDNDAGHLAWTHRSTALRSGRLDYLLPVTETFKETDYGFLSLRNRPGRTADPHRVYMPNTRHWRSKTRARAYQAGDLIETKFTWSVPIDDEHYVGFDVTLTPLTGEDAEAYMAEREEEQEPQAEQRWEIARAILAGKMTNEQIPDEISYYNMNAIDDYVTQVGQGAIADRAPGVEHPGRHDARVIFYRKLWLRELAALAQGRPLKAWKVPDELLWDELLSD
jgi:5,5'-dehydrodivanillate O-demethylase